MGLTNRLFRTNKWSELLKRLQNKEIPDSEIGSAIVKLGKPYNKERINAAKETVAAYLNHEDDWVRHEAIWFLTSWGKLPEYQPAVIYALRHDPFVDNRSFAASCLGRLRKGSQNQDAIHALKEVVLDGKEDEIVRNEAYSSLLEVAKDQPESFSNEDRKLSDIDWPWVNSLV